MAEDDQSSIKKIAAMPPEERAVVLGEMLDAALSRSIIESAYGKRPLSGAVAQAALGRIRDLSGGGKHGDDD